MKKNDDSVFKLLIKTGLLVALILGCVLFATLNQYRTVHQNSTTVTTPIINTTNQNVSTTTNQNIATNATPSSTEKPVETTTSSVVISTSKVPEATTTSKPQTPTNVTIDHIPSEAEFKNMVQVKLITNNEVRPRKLMNAITHIVIHYTANPGAGADNHYRYFNYTATSTSCHYIVGLEGEIIQIIPDNEVAYHAGTSTGPYYNYFSIGIEVCHPDNTGKYTDASYEALLKLVSYLCAKYNIPKENVIRHYDVSGKACPLYFVNDPKQWNEFKSKLIFK